MPQILTLTLIVFRDGSVSENLPGDKSFRAERFYRAEARSLMKRAVASLIGVLSRRISWVGVSVSVTISAGLESHASRSEETSTV